MAWSRAWVPSQRVRQLRWRKHQILATRLVVSDKGPVPSALQKIISTKMESSEANKVFVKRKKSPVCMDRHTGRLRGTVPELHPCGILNHLYETFLLVFLWPVILICLVHSPYLVYLRILPCCASTSLSQDGSYCKGIWIAWH